jgi:hypothetical protein
MMNLDWFPCFRGHLSNDVPFPFLRCSAKQECDPGEFQYLLLLQ